MTTRTTRAPFGLTTYCDIINKTNAQKVEKNFNEKASIIASALGEDIVKDLGSNPLTQNILLHALENGRIKNSYIVFIAKKSSSYQEAAPEDKPYIFLYKAVTVWYKEIFEKEYWNVRDKIFYKLNVPLSIFIKAETSQKFRTIVPFLRKSSLKHVSDELNKLSTDFETEELETILTDVA